MAAIDFNTELGSKASKLQQKGFKQYCSNNIKDALNLFTEANKIYTSIHDMSNISICLSWIGLLNYLTNNSNYYKIIIMLNDAKFLAENSASERALFNYYYVYGSINYLDENYSEALYHLDKASHYETKEEDFKGRIYILMANIFEKYEQFDKAYQYYELASHFSSLTNFNSIDSSLFFVNSFS